MHIVFLLPGHAKKPIGGHKIVYQYANMFIDDGYKVSIVYGASGLFEKDKFKDKYKSILRYVYFKVTGEFKPYHWFNLNKKVNLYFNWDLKQNNVPKADKYICTSVETSYRLNKFNDNIDKFYFIQDYENWKWGKEKVIESWKFKLNKIVISSWLKELVNKTEEKAILVENGFDFNIFNLDKPISEKENNKVIMLFHTAAHKGVQNGFNALEIVKQKFPNLQVTLFGTFPKPIDLPTWYEYYQSPDKDKLRALYNDAAIFVGSSIEEGWGLTLGESMQCGCAVACTDNKGYGAMAIHDKTALVSRVGDIEMLATNISKLIEDDNLRFHIANNGNLHIKNFTVESAYDKFKKAILNYD